jgi:hypothetical protein
MVSVLLLFACAETALAQTSPNGNPGQTPYPDPSSIHLAKRFLAKRAGRTSFAVINSGGRLAGMRLYRTSASASVVKGMLLVAYLRHLHAEHRGLMGADKAILHPMIHVSDNTAADAAFQRIGRQHGLSSLARTAHMKDFSPSSSWGLSRISAGDQARFFFEMNKLIPVEFRGYARGLLSHITPSQSWGIPAAARPRQWRVFFKGGWLPSGLRLVNQVAWLERGETRVAIAVLTEGDPSMGYGEQTIRGVTRRLLKNGIGNGG